MIVGLMDIYLILFFYDYGFLMIVISVVVSLFVGFNIVGILLFGIVVDWWSSWKILCFLYVVCVLLIVILIYSYEFYLFLVFVILFGLVDFVMVVLI